MRQFKEIEHKGCSITDLSVLSIAEGLSNLQNLNLSGCKNVTSDSVITLADSCHNLLSLDLSGWNITDRCVVRITEKCSNLKYLCLRSCRSITDLAIARIAVLPDLQNLNLCKYSATAITDSSITKIGERCHNLQVLSLCNCCAIIDVSVCCIADGCRQLKRLDLWCCFAVSDVGLSRVAEKCKGLKRLNISYCNITDDAIFASAERSFHLKILYAEWCHGLSDAAVVIPTRYLKIDTLR